MRFTNNTEVVFSAVVELHSNQQKVSRNTIRDLTGLPLGIVDDRLKALVRDERVIRMDRGEYEPADVCHEARAVSVTALPNGQRKIEVGDYVILLWPTELRLLAEMLQGAAVAASQIITGRAVLSIANSVNSTARMIERRLSELG